MSNLEDRKRFVKNGSDLTDPEIRSIILKPPPKNT